MAYANSEVTVTVMIEDKEGIENYREILAVPGIDYIAAGRGDISIALGVPGQTAHPEVLRVRKMILDEALRHGIRSGESGAPRCIAEDKGLLLDGIMEKIKQQSK